MAQDKPNIKYGPNVSPHDSTSAQHGPTLLHISATCVHVGSTQPRPNIANNMTQHGPNIDQGGSTLAQHGLKRTQQQPNMARFFFNMSLRQSQHSPSATCPKKKGKQGTKNSIKNSSNATQNCVLLGIYIFLENDLNRLKLNDTEMPKSKIKANKTKAQRHWNAQVQNKD